MNKLIIAGVTFLACCKADAASVVFSHSFRQVTPEEISDSGGPGFQYQVNDFFLTTDADILSINSVFIEHSGTRGNLYNNAAGSNSSSPNPAFVAVFPSLGADSWITTPGETSIAGGDLGDANASWFDTTDDGPQQDFQFARLTTNDIGQFSGVVSVAGINGPEHFPFRLCIRLCPEPTTFVMAAIAGFGLICVRRRNIQPLNFASLAR